MTKEIIKARLKEDNRVIHVVRSEVRHIYKDYYDGTTEYYESELNFEEVHNDFMQ